MLSLRVTQCVLGFYENKVVSASKASDIDKGLLTFLSFLSSCLYKKRRKNQQCAEKGKYVYTHTTRNWVPSLKQHV